MLIWYCGMWSRIFGDKLVSSEGHWLGLQIQDCLKFDLLLFVLDYLC